VPDELAPATEVVAPVAPEALPVEPDAAPAPRRPASGLRNSLSPRAQDRPNEKTTPPVPAPTSSTKKLSCDPNFYLDAQGEKHFKPECF
jgi:hypothetical protein